ncbi:AKT1-like K+ channel 1, partial [Striga asiatica]
FNGGGSSARTHAPTPLFEVIELIVDVKGCQQTIVIISWEKNPYPESKKLFTKIAVAYEANMEGFEGSNDSAEVASDDFKSDINDREERSYNTSNMLTDTNHMLANGRMDVPLSLCFVNAHADDLLLHYLLRWGRELNELYRNNSTALV